MAEESDAIYHVSIFRCSLRIAVKFICDAVPIYGNAIVWPCILCASLRPDAIVRSA